MAVVIVLSALFALLIFTALSVSAYAAAPDIAWNKTYDVERSGAHAIPNAYEGYDANLNVNDGYVIIGADANHALLAKTDKNGNILWNRSYGGRGDTFVSGIAVEDGFVLAGFTRTLSDPPGVSYSVYLVKTDLNGKLEWQKAYNDLPLSTANEIIAVKDGYVIVGYCNGVTEVFLMKTFTNGTPMWSQRYRGNKYQGISRSSYRATSLAAAADGYVIGGCEDADVYRNCLIKTDRDGNRAWVKTYESTGLNLASYPSFVHAVKDGYYFVGTTDVGDRINIFLLKTDVNGNALWDKTFSGEGDAAAGGIIPVSNGFVIAGLTGNRSTNFLTYLYLVKVDLKGNMIWNHTYSRISSIRSMIADNNSYVILGTGNENGISGPVLLIKTTQDTDNIPDVVPAPSPGVGMIAAILLGASLYVIKKRRNN